MQKYIPIITASSTYVPLLQTVRMSSTSPTKSPRCTARTYTRRPNLHMRRPRLSGQRKHWLKTPATPRKRDGKRWRRKRVKDQSCRRCHRIWVEVSAVQLLQPLVGYWRWNASTNALTVLDPSPMGNDIKLN